MAKGWCLIKDQAMKFKRALKTGEIDPAKLANMSSGERRAYLENFVGKENGQQVNALFESKLLLKNQKAGMISWAKRVGGMTKESRRDLITKIERLDKVLDPKTEKEFLQDLASQRLGVDVTQAEAKNIFDLSKKMEQLASKRNPDTLEFPSTKERLDYGAAKIALMDYVNDLKLNAAKLSLLERGKPINYLKNASDIAGLAKSAKASLDNSAIFRQGWKTLWTNPLIWMKNAAKTFGDFAATIKDGDKVMKGIMADLVSRPNYERMQKGKLAIGNIEEAFPTSLPERLPFLGRVFKGSQTAYEGFIYRQRADIFDSYIGIMKKSGLDINDPKQLTAISKVINSLTGRGNLGAAEPVANLANNFFFSPRFLKSHLDVLTVQSLDKDITPFARKQAATNLVKIILGTAAVLGIAKAVNPDAVETDPRSSDFGKIKVGNTRFDMSGGMASVLTLVSRVLTSQSKSSTTGKVTDLNSGDFGSQTVKDVVYNFFENKLSPAAAVVRDLMKGENFDGEKPTITGIAKDLFLPLPVTNFKELKEDPNAAPVLLAMMADALGIGTNTYGKSKTDWNKSESKELTQFKEKVGEEEFKKANEKFNTEFDKWAQKVYRSPEYQNLSDDGKQSVIDSAKEEIKSQIFKEYRYRYRKARTTTEQREEKKVIKNLLP